MLEIKQFNANLGSKKAQSAMEYLMTYGWAILIVAVILGILFQLGVFSSSNLLGTSCSGSPGYLCQSPVTLTTSGTLTFTIGQSTGVPLYNIQVACVASTTGGLPNPITAFNTITASGQVLPPSQTGNTLVAGGTITVSALPCYGAGGIALGNIPLGTNFAGGIWMNYTARAVAENPAANPWLTVKAATLRLAAS